MITSNITNLKGYCPELEQIYFPSLISRTEVKKILSLLAILEYTLEQTTPPWYIELHR